MIKLLDRSASADAFKFGDFVRLRNHPELWGRIVGPSEMPGRWVFEYSQGARVTNAAEAFEAMEPTAAQRRQTAARFAELASRRPAAEWPEGVNV